MDDWVTELISWISKIILKFWNSIVLYFLIYFENDIVKKYLTQFLLIGHAQQMLVIFSWINIIYDKLVCLSRLFVGNYE